MLGKCLLHAIISTGVSLQDMRPFSTCLEVGLGIAGYTKSRLLDVIDKVVESVPHHDQPGGLD